MLTAKEIRKSFKSFFEARGHKIVPSAPMVIKDDPTLMFTNAGMNQFKDIILGNHEAKYKRVANSQKCLRVSGKHNDLEEVGHDTYHHTMFEMLGNWSFGDYFKKEAIEWAWEYLVDVLKLDKNRLYATIFEGSPEEALDKDEEAYAMWKKFLPEAQIIDGNKADNFWEMGDTGPCGPCSEIHIDLRTNEERKKIDGAELVNKDHPHVIEIWNLVFMQYNRKADGSLDPLPNKVIDTGMGFERLCAVLQGKVSNYDTDVFQPIIKEISNITNLSYGKEEEIDIAMRVISDHIRTISFSITDGQLPSNAKAGYVIRRILRRAVRYAYTFLNQKQAFMYKLVPVLVENMGDAYPELKAQESLIEKVIKEEEDAFLHTLETGIHLLEKTIQEARDNNTNVISGKAAFTLYDTFGFPLDLTELISREKGKSVDIEEFNSEMSKQRERARSAASVETGDWIILKEGTSQFIGYDFTEYEVSILRYREVKRKKDKLYQIVLDKTPFYAESGGQVGDTGKLTNSTETIDIIDTINENNLTVHLAKQLPKNVMAPFKAIIDIKKRELCAANHTATHLLDQALREVLGNHVEQKGSLVTPEYIRFDFSHYQKMSDEEIREVEKIINERIRKNIPLNEFRNLPIEEAKKMGAIALFGEKYGDEVRVVQFDSSIEFCGGTHTPSTGHIGIFKIISESSIAAGVRRIEAVTGARVEELMYTVQDMISDIRLLFNNAPDLVAAIKKQIEGHEELQQEIAQYMKEKKADIKKHLLDTSKTVNGIQLIKLNAPLPVDHIKDIAFQLRGEIPENMFFVAGSDYNLKPSLTIMLSDNLVEEGLNAGKIIREAAKLIQGGGGGQPHFATAGGKNTEGLTQAMDKILELANLKKERN